jgi:hypothetical protein
VLCSLENVKKVEKVELAQGSRLDILVTQETVVAAAICSSAAGGNLNPQQQSYPGTVVELYSTMAGPTRQAMIMEYIDIR